MSSVARGSQSGVNWKTESSYGVAPTGNWNQMPINSETLDENIDTIQTDDIQQNRENPSIRGGNITTAGQITHDLTPTRTLTWFQHMIASAAITSTTISAPSAIAAITPYNRGDYVLAGAGGTIWCCLRGGTTPATVTGLLTGTGVIDLSGGTRWVYTAANATTLYQHVLTPAITFPTGGLAFEKGILGGTAMYVQFLGCRVSSFDLSAQQSGPVKASWNFTAKSSTKLTTTGAGTPVLDSEDFYGGLDTYVHLNDTQGAGGVTFKSFNANFTNGLQEDCFVLGERYRFDLPEGRKVSSGKLSMYFLDSTQYDMFKNETVVSLAVTFIRAGLQIKIEWDEVKLTGSGTPNVSGQGAVMQDFNWTSFYQSGATKPFTVTAKNLTAGGSLPV